MKIHESQRVSRILPHRTHAASGERVSGKSKNQKDIIQISSEAKQLLEAQRNGSAERAERVQALKYQVQAGTYHVQAELVAEKLLPFLK